MEGYTMELFVSSHEPKVNLSVKCRLSIKETFQKLCKDTNLNQTDFFESAILLLSNPTSANWRKWQKIHQDRIATTNRPTEDELIKMSEELKTDPATEWHDNIDDLKASLKIGISDG